MISIALATYNGEKYLEKQIQSYLEQTILPDEIVIFDDCSTDSTIELLTQFQKKIKNIDMKIIQHDKNEGYAKTFFDAILNTKGDYVFISDQDDIWGKTKLEQMVVTMENNKEILCLSSLYSLIDKDDKLLSKQIDQASMGDIVKITSEEFMRGKFRPGFTLCISHVIRDMLRSVSIEKFPSHDRLLEFLAITENGFFILNKKLNLYRIHNTNTSGVTLGFVPRANLEGRISQAKKEADFFENVLEIMMNVEIDKKSGIFQDCEDIIKIYNNRINYLEKSNLIKCLISTNKTRKIHNSKNIILGDILFTSFLGRKIIGKFR